MTFNMCDPSTVAISYLCYCHLLLVLAICTFKKLIGINVAITSIKCWVKHHCESDHFNVFKCWRQHKHLLKTVVIQAKLIFAEWHHKAYSRGELFPYYKTTPKLLIILVIVHCSKHPRYCLDTVFQLSIILECEQQICSSHHKVYIWQP